MTIIQRIEKIISGLIQIAFGAVLFIFPEDGYQLVLTVLGFALALRGLRQLYYYFSMARFMVNGRLILVTGLVFLDFGLFSETLYDVPKIYIILYKISFYFLGYC